MTRAWLVVALACALVACGGSRRPTRSNVETGEGYEHHGAGGASSSSASPDAAVAFTSPGALACAPAYADLQGACDPAVHDQTCTYPEGVCYCGIDYPCSGVRIPDEQLARLPNEWQCTPTPPAVRPDGCPGVQPSSSACTTEGKICSYGDCCFTRMTCVKGTWQRTGGGCPP